jgi:CheY-like chemotaxis protein
VSTEVLVVDDHPGNLKLLSFVLEAHGYVVRTATDAEDALRVLTEFRPRLILMDLQLPGMDGLTLTSKLRANPQYDTTLIVAVTASAMKGDEEKAVKAGCDGYITKPVDTRALPRVVASILGTEPSPRG